MLPEILSLEDPAWPAWLRSSRLSLQGQIYYIQERFAEALSALMEQQELLLQEPGEQLGLDVCQSHLCAALNLLQRHEEAIELARTVVNRDRGEHSGSIVFTMLQLMLAQIALGRIDDAWQTMRQAMPGWRRDSYVLFASGTLGLLLAERRRWADAARLGGAAAAYNCCRNVTWHPLVQRESAHLRELLDAAACPPADIERWQREGEALDEAAIAGICLREEEPFATEPPGPAALRGSS
jgi:tetratricopeptide (TPR) repeat protein